MSAYTEERLSEPTDPPLATDSPSKQTTTEPQLTSKLDPRWALGPVHVVLAALWGALFMLLNWIPLRPTDLWGHVIYGRWILEHGQLPTEDPFFRWAEGMRVVDTAWLAQTIFALVYKNGGYEGLSNLFAVVGMATFLFLARAIYLQTRSPSMTAVGVFIAVVVGWSRLLTIRPEIFGALCFTALLWLIVSSDGSTTDARGQPAPARWWRLWVGVPLIFAAWANLHGSFLCGLAVLGCFFLGRVLEVLWTTRDPQQVLADRNVRRWLLLCELGLAATLLNPYGIDVLIEAVTFSANENLRDVLEWQPLVILGVGGREFAISWVVLLIVLRHSRRPVPVAHALLLGLFTLAAVFGVRMITWYAAIYALVLTPHLATLAARFLPALDARPSEPQIAAESGGEPVSLPPGRSWKYSLISALILWIAFALSPISYAVPWMKGNKPPRTTEKILGTAMTPVALTDYLVAHAEEVQGPIFNPQWWGDWLGFAGPQGMQPFMTTNIHLAPRQVWQDYMHVLQTRAGWQNVLRRYRVSTLVLDKQIQQNIINAAKFEQNWTTVYEDDMAVVLKINEPSRGDAARDSEQRAPQGVENPDAKASS